MDQKELRELERRCIEEEPPWCAAACPLHVDARALAGRVAAADWAGAWKALLRAMPLPGVLGRVCDQPCRERCKRAEAGGAINIGDLERVVVGHRAPLRTSPRLPGKNKTVAVLGAGLAGLTAAWDLGRKGYRVVVRHADDSPGQKLLEQYGEAVPAEAVEAELALLAKAGVEFKAVADLSDPGLLEETQAAVDGVILSLDAVAPEAVAEGWPLERDAGGRPIVASPAQATRVEGVFAAGRADSPVWRAAQGRWAATSLDRWLEGVSPTAGRDKDGPFETRLFTSLDGVEPQVPVAAADPAGYDDAEAQAEGARCLQCRCLECVKVCAYLERFGSYPKKYAREIYNNQSIVMGAHQANKLIDSCSLCGLCERVCPEDFAMADLCLEARREMVAKGKMPPSAHEFALLDMEFSLGDEFRLARHQPGHAASAHLFFPGCQLAASAPGQVRGVYEHLCASLPGGVGLMLACCGAPALWAGREERLTEALAAWREDWQALGSPSLIMACPSCRDVFRQRLPEVEQVFLWEVLDEHPASPAVPPSETLAVHDPCTARHDAAAQESVRSALAAAGVATTELDLGRNLTECCGFGGLMANANPDLAREVTTRRAARSDLDYVTYCAVCRDRLAAVDKRAVTALDLFFPEGADDPAARPGPGWSQRRENRARLKDSLLRDLWGEETPSAAQPEEPALLIAPEVWAVLEARRILLEDVQKVVARAEAGGPRLLHPDSGHYLASHRPYRATFWVEYSPEGDGFRVHNAYAHRMTVKGG